ncbi:MAG: RES domain-containing protein [Acidobacteria bacterium]|nr:RES domain-containing protein [Acidobacteriota bacterium]
MHAYRIGSRAHPLLDGRGAAATDDARWNGRGRYVVYAAEHYGTALLEKAAQLHGLKIPRTLVYVRIEIPPNASLEEVRIDDLPGWDSDSKAESQAFGNRWYEEQRSLVLLVPSLAAPGLERNVLINQRHPEFRRVTASDPERARCHPKLLA